ncbi:MAG: Rossmann-like and DUF2520 domain-containing protein [Bacteroidales bacterium]
MQSIKKVVIIGAGNLAVNLAMSFHSNGLQIVQIVNRTKANAAKLASKINTSFTDNFNEIDLSADLYVIAVSDEAISAILCKLKLRDKLVVHTAGSVDMNILSTITVNFGVFYPLQTFSTSDIIDFSNIPICLEANSLTNESLLIDLSEKLSNNIQIINTEKRKIIHLSAVIASNFSNYMYLVASDILTENRLSFDLLKPLIQRTAEKIQNHSAHNAMTGPAKRNDNTVINEHIKLLENNKNYQDLYKLISNCINKHFNKI